NTEYTATLNLRLKKSSFTNSALPRFTHNCVPNSSVALGFQPVSIETQSDQNGQGTFEQLQKCVDIYNNSGNGSTALEIYNS
ncbi:10684_t:CDS:2, partial [Scutellospora calospora]